MAAFAWVGPHIWLKVSARLHQSAARNMKPSQNARGREARRSRNATLAVLAYVVPTFITSFVWHLVAFHHATRLNIYRPDPIIPSGVWLDARTGFDVLQIRRQSRPRIPK